MSAPAPPITIATRGSALALAQARAVQAWGRAALPGQAFELRIIKTTGDKLLTASLASGDLPKGLFTKELEAALQRNEADLAVHSLKDLPTELPAGLTLGAVSARADVRDVLLSRSSDASRAPLTVAALPRAATVGTSSTRRRAQLLDQRPDLNIVPLRGNVGSRLKKLAEQPELDAIILAAAGLERLGFTISPQGSIEGDAVPAGLRAAPLSVEEMLPAVGQAALGLEIRDDDDRLKKLCVRLNDRATWSCVLAERAFLHAMGGGCHLAVAAYGQMEGERIHLRGVSHLSGTARRGELRGPATDPAELGRQLAQALLP